MEKDLRAAALASELSSGPQRRRLRAVRTDDSEHHDDAPGRLRERLVLIVDHHGDTITVAAPAGDGIVTTMARGVREGVEAGAARRWFGGFWLLRSERLRQRVGPLVSMDGRDDLRPLGDPLDVRLRSRRNARCRSPELTAGLLSVRQDDECREGRSTDGVVQAIVQLAKRSVPATVRLEPISSSGLVLPRKLLVRKRLFCSRPASEDDVEIVEVHRCHRS